MDYSLLLTSGLCALSSLVLGGIWYSPLVTGKVWAKVAGFGDSEPGPKCKFTAFSVLLVMSFIAAYIFGIYFGSGWTMGNTVLMGFGAGAGFVATSFAINYIFERKPFKLFLINGGYHSLQFTLFGLIYGWM